MSDTKTVSSLLTELATILDLDALIQHDDGDDGTSWDVVFDEALLIQAFLPAEADKITLTADLATPEESDSARIHKLLLEYNYLWRETSGVRMAIEAPVGTVVMIYDVAVEGLDSVLLRNILQNFASAAQAWKALLEGGPSDGTEAPAYDIAAEGSQDAAMFIRV